MQKGGLEEREPERRENIVWLGKALVVGTDGGVRKEYLRPWGIWLKTTKGGLGGVSLFVMAVCQDNSLCPTRERARSGSCYQSRKCLVREGRLAMYLLQGTTIA